MRLGEYLVSQTIISDVQLAVSLEEQEGTNEKLGDILCRNKFCSRQDVYNALAILNPRSLIGEQIVQSDIPEDVLFKHHIILKAITTDEIYYTSLIEKDMAEDILRQYIPSSKRFVFLDGLELSELNMSMNELEKTVTRKGRDIQYETNPSHILINIIEHAVLRKASDIHIQTSHESIRIKLRLDSLLQNYAILGNKSLDTGATLASALTTILKDISGMDMAETSIPQDGSFSRIVSGRSVDFRINIQPTVHGNKITIRVLDGEVSLMPLKRLGFPPQLMSTWKELSQLPSGLILIGGSTSNGKSTTLYATIKSLINYFQFKVVTIEDPVEYIFPQVTQIGITKAMPFDEIHKSLVRSDPDIVIVGELRDIESATLAIRLAHTGHLVYATVHNNDVISTISRLKHFSVDTDNLRNSLRAILCQKLVRKLCTLCHGVGCQSCNNGYKGRTGHFEFLDLRYEGRFNKIYTSDKPDKSCIYTFEQDRNRILSEGLTDEKELTRVSVMIMKENNMSDLLTEKHDPSSAPAGDLAQVHEERDSSAPEPASDPARVHADTSVGDTSSSLCQGQAVKQALLEAPGEEDQDMSAPEASGDLAQVHEERDSSAPEPVSDPARVHADTSIGETSSIPCQGQAVKQPHLVAPGEEDQDMSAPEPAGDLTQVHEERDSSAPEPVSDPARFHADTSAEETSSLPCQGQAIKQPLLEAPGEEDQDMSAPKPAGDLTQVHEDRDSSAPEPASDPARVHADTSVGDTSSPSCQGQAIKQPLEEDQVMPTPKASKLTLIELVSQYEMANNDFLEHSDRIDAAEQEIRFHKPLLEEALKRKKVLHEAIIEKMTASGA